MNDENYDDHENPDRYDDLEQRLGQWRPADLPPVLMRRLRAAEPAPVQSPAGRCRSWPGGWRSPGAIRAHLRRSRLFLSRKLGSFAAKQNPWRPEVAIHLVSRAAGVALLLAACILIFSAFPKQPPAPVRDREASNGSTRGLKRGFGPSSAGFLTTAPQAADFNVGNFNGPGLKFALLACDQSAATGAALNWEAPSEPMRLGCGCSIGQASNHSLGQLNLKIDEQF